MKARHADIRQAVMYPFARRFFAGTTLDDAVLRAREVNAKGIGATLDFLGEDVRTAGEAEAARAEYARALDAASKGGGLQASVAVKLTHVGLSMDPGLAMSNVGGLAERARRNGVFLWIDMEGSVHTDDILATYRKLLEKYGGGIGVALQACLKRTWADMEPLVGQGATIRLVKGAYKEPPEVAVQDMGEIRARFAQMMGYLFREAGQFAIGTHDRGLVRRALELGRDKKGGFEFQMLMGMRDGLKRRLSGGGHRVVEYVPYGADWYGYGMRRLKERRRNLWYFAQGLVGR